MKYPTNIQLRECIKNIGGRLTHSSKQECVKYINSLYWYKTFPWREEQQQVFNIFIEQQYKHIVIQGIFGVGKSQMLLGLLFMALLECDFHYSDILYTAFNVCVKNEIKKKLGNHGLKKIKVSTFDSIVYTLCKYNDMKDYNEPNYEGRRKFLYNSQFKTNLENFKLVILDECQDLEIQALDMLKRAFPNAFFIFAGDILQSIQKEPKESVLWQIMMNGDKYSINEYKKIFMYQTPRVPKNILNEIRIALGNFYPELTDEFSKWKSQNTTTDGRLSWHQFSTYKEIFDKLLVFCSQHDHRDIMVLTFSSSITVRGTLGDVSRIRNFLKGKNIPVNHNHKMMDHDKLFLSTANSSKGLERKFVFVILSFPLEKAFLNFSNDLVMNLLTVALSRAQQTIDIYASKIIEKSSQLLQFYKAPEPTIHYKYVPEKGKKEIVVSDDGDDFSYDTITNTSHSVVETLNLGILKYSTLSTLKNHAKVIFKSKLTNYFNYTEFIPKLTRDEERVLAGLLVEHLITSQLQEAWPFTAVDVNSLSANPNYKHCIKKIQTLLAIYDKMKSKSFNGSSVDYIFSTLHIYSQLHLALTHRIFVSLSDFDMAKLKSYWQSSLYNSIIDLKLATVKQNTTTKVQSSCKMPYMTGIIDVFFQDKGESFNSFTFWEIKASTAYDWVDNALAQVMLYVLMNAKSYCSVVLINPFKNVCIKYAISIPNINTMRHTVINDCIMYNVNSYLAKNLTNTVNHDTQLNMLNSIFVQIQSCNDGNLMSIQVCKLFSPTKIDILYDKVGIACNWVDDKDSEMYKLGKETYDSIDTVLNECKNICSTFKHIYCNTITKEYLKDLSVNFFDTESNNNITNIVQLSTNTKFVY
jgi:hypothetical protein